MLAHLLFRLAPTAVRLWLLLNRGLDELATTKATLGATQETGIAALGSPGTSRIHAFLAGVYPPTPRPNTSLMMVTMMMRLVMVVHATTMSLVNSNFHLE